MLHVVERIRARFYSVQQTASSRMASFNLQLLMIHWATFAEQRVQQLFKNVELCIVSKLEKSCQLHC